MELWNKVCTTDPAYTKKVSLGRTFTAIDPMYQIMNATKHMGVAGQGWGFSVEDTAFLPTDQVAIKVRVWCGKRENYIEQWGQNGLYMDRDKKKPDTDCMKKATTDGLTKGLTYFGFNADVFLGKFDDNKYVAEVSQAEAKKKEVEERRKKAEAWVNEYLADFAHLQEEDLTVKEKDNAAMLKRIAEGYPDLHKIIMREVGKIRMPTPSGLTQ